MNFSYSEKTQEYINRVQKFVDEIILPNEQKYYDQLEGSNDFTKWKVPPIMEEMKAKDAIEIDVRGKTSIADYLVVASGTSSRHVKSVADEVVKFAKNCGVMPLGVEGGNEAEWVLVDLGDVIVHVFRPEVREFYNLEKMWSATPPGEKLAV